MPETIIEIDARDIIPTQPVDVSRRPGIDKLDASLERNGQREPVIVCDHPTLPGKLDLLEGYGRFHCLSRQGMKIRAIKVAAPADEAERIRLTFIHQNRRTMTPEEKREKASRSIDFKNCTQKQAALDLDMSETEVSRAFSTMRVSEDLRHYMVELKASIFTLISPLPTHEMMRKAFAFAAAPDEKSGKPRTRDQVARYIAAEVNPRRPKGRPPKPRVEVKLGAGSIIESMTIRSGSDPKLIIKELRGITGLIETGSCYGFDAVVAILKGRKPPDSPTASVSA